MDFAGKGDLMGRFAVDVQRLCEKIALDADIVVEKVVLDVSTSLVYKSPVGDAKYWKHAPPPGYVGGRFRANWQYGNGEVNLTTTEEIDADGLKTISRIAESVGKDAAGRNHYISNSLPYAQRLEDGWSYRQAPNGMVGLTQIEFQAYVDKAVAEL